jgi:hypothetical protein
MNTAPLRRGSLLHRRFFVQPKETVSSSRPAIKRVPSTAAVRAGRRPLPAAARSGLDGGEHGAILRRGGTNRLPEHGALPTPLRPRSSADRFSNCETLVPNRCHD